MVVATTARQVAKWLQANRAQVPFGRLRDGGFGVGQDVRFPPAAINLLECEGFDSLDDAAYCRGSKRNEIWIASHEADVTAVLHHGYDVTCEQRALAPATAGRRWPMQHRAAFKMTAAIDQGHAIPKRKRCSFPKLNARSRGRGRHDPLTISSVQKYLRIKALGPINHCRVKVWMRDCNGAEAAARVDFGSGLIVQESNAVPEQISAGRLQEQCTLPDCKFRFGADPEKAGRFVFNSVLMITREPTKRGPFLTGVTNELPLDFADGARGWRSCSLVKLRSALDADEV